MEHQFTPTIIAILNQHFPGLAGEIFERSTLIQYLNIKTRSAMRGSKSRSSFANIYAIYVLIEDYLKMNFDKKKKYSNYEGAKFTELLKRQRELPFGSKLQNHALNHRLNEEYRKYFPQSQYIPILRNVETNRYWINENLIKITTGGVKINLAQAVINIVDSYIAAKEETFRLFIQACEKIKLLSNESKGEAKDFILELLAPNVDARIFEIVSYAILKYYYIGQTVYFGLTVDSVEQENLKLYKTGRTNANDGGIDFVMRPLGRFFQVTETFDVRKYFLDIDKIERYPISFVIKSEDSIESLKGNLKSGAEKIYAVKAIINKYMNCIEEIINIPVIQERFIITIGNGHLSDIMGEIIKQSSVEFNIEEDEEEELSADA